MAELALNQRELLSSLLDKIGVAFPKCAPFFTELRLLRVVEFHCDFIAGRKVSLGKLILQAS
jgi:hypothetical protein